MEAMLLLGSTICRRAKVPPSRRERPRVRTCCGLLHEVHLPGCGVDVCGVLIRVNVYELPSDTWRGCRARVRCDQILVAFQSGISLVLLIQNLLMSPVNFSAADNAMQIHVVHTCRSYQ